MNISAFMTNVRCFCIITRAEVVSIMQACVWSFVQLTGSVSLFSCQLSLDQACSAATGSWWKDGAVALEMAQVSRTALTEHEVTAVLSFTASTSP